MQIASGQLDLYHILQVEPGAHASVIDAAYRALARMLHPDHSHASTNEAMALLNRAYGVLRDPARRAAYDQTRLGAAPSNQAPIVTPPPTTTSRDPAVLAYGRYAGWALEQVLVRDPDYLRWLARHTSGRHYRTQIERLFAQQQQANRCPSMSGRRNPRRSFEPLRSR